MRSIAKFIADTWPDIPKDELSTRIQERLRERTPVVHLGLEFIEVEDHEYEYLAGLITQDEFERKDV